MFIDEITLLTQPGIKLFRNICRVLGLSCVLAATSAQILNLLNLNSASALRINAIWVHAIRTLPKANVKAIFHVLNWNRYTDGDGNLNLNRLLDGYGFNIKSDDREFKLLENLFWLMQQQSETCLQGVSIYMFQALKKVLETQSKTQLNVQAIWKDSLIYLRSILQSRKPKAFLEIGRFHTLAMMSNFQMVSESEEDQLAPTSEIIMETINQHFYFFGRTTDEIVIPFGYNGTELIFDGCIYKMCSYFK